MPLAIASAATAGLIAIGIIVFPQLYAYYIYPQTNTATMYLSGAYKPDIERNMAENPDISIHSIGDNELSRYPQLKEGIEYLQVKDEGRDISSFYLISEQCSFAPHGGGGCSPLVPFRMSEVSKVREALQLRATGYDYIEYRGNYYFVALGEPELKPVYNGALLLGIFASITGSITIWLVWAKIEANRIEQSR